MAEFTKTLNMERKRERKKENKTNIHSFSTSSSFPIKSQRVYNRLSKSVPKVLRKKFISGHNNAI
jgi:hypothetical protein